MKKIVDFPSGDVSGFEDSKVIICDRSRTEFLASVYALNDYIKNLPLNRQQNDTLIDLIVKNMNETERGSFGVGLKLGMKYGKE